MDDKKRLEAVLAAVTGALVGEGEKLAVDLELLEEGLDEAGVRVTQTTNRGALAAELTVVREELRVQRTRLRHSVREGHEDAGEINDLLKRLAEREGEITGLLWPAR